LGQSLHADVILIDDRKGVAVAVKKGLQVSGTLGLLTLAARRELLDLAAAFSRLKKTNCRYRPEMMEALLNPSRKS
jgi:predicted nucleic acid-binding protein